MNETALRIRQARDEDVDSLPAIERASATLFLEWTHACGMSAEMLDQTRMIDELRRACAEERLWIAEVGAEPAGFALVARLDADRLHLDELAVHPAHGRKGLGTALVDRVCAQALDLDCAEVTLSTFRHIPWNRPFYERLGFRELSAAAAPPGLVRLRDEEARRGLRVDLRVLMAKSLEDRRT